MTDDRLTRAISDTLSDLATGHPTDYIDDVLARTARTRQRPAWTFPGRYLSMSPVLKFATFATLAVGASLAFAAATSPAPDPSPGAMPEATIATLGPGREQIAPGTYRMRGDGPGPNLPGILITLPDGWENLDGWAVHRGPFGDPTVAIQLWSVRQVYGHPCQWQGTLFDPGPSVDELADALASRPLRDATQPVDVELDGRPGKYLEWSVPPDADFTACDTDGFEHYFESWTGATGGDRYQQGPGQVDRLWILDVDGGRLVIDAFDMPSATEAEREELLDVVASIRFEPPSVE